jgi:hypothetical protein
MEDERSKGSIVGRNQAMSRETLIAFGGGSASALLAASLFAGVPGAWAFVNLVPLPLFLVGLSRGVGPGAIASATGVVVSALLNGVSGGASYAIVHALPAWMVNRKATLRIQGPDGSAEWYPIGLILSSLTGFAAALLAAVSVLLIPVGPGIETAATAQLTAYVNAFLPDLADALRRDFIQHFAPVFMGSVAAGWVVLIVLNAALAQKILSRLGWNARPSPRFGDLRLPDWASWLLVAACATALFGPGEAGYVGRNVALVSAVPFVFVGLAVAHAYAHRTIIPGMALVGFYLALVILGWPNGVMLVGALGAAEVWYGLRRKGGPRGEGGAPARTNDQES